MEEEPKEEEVKKKPDPVKRKRDAEDEYEPPGYTWIDPKWKVMEDFLATYQ